MTTQACNLAGRLPSGPIRIQRTDKSYYTEHDEAEINRMVAAGVVEGKGPKSGRIESLRIICTEVEAIQRVAAIKASEPVEPKGRSGSITSDASREIFRQQLSNTLWVFCHKGLAGMEFKKAA